jgi:hypothetical protein
MRSALVALVLTAIVPACASEESKTTDDATPPREATPEDLPPNKSPGGGTPPNECGATFSGSAVGCGLLDVAGGKYCSDYRASPSSAGQCLAPFTSGTMTATIEGAAFDATLVGARLLSTDTIEIAGFSAPNASSSEATEPGEGLRLTVGATTSGKCWSLGFTETRVGPVWFSFADVGSCTFELSDTGGSSGTVTGTFAATLRQSSATDAPSRNVTGSFSVKLSP